jgi:dTDP-4-amino-4,6-dideoxygalactose transaminase
MANYFFHPAWQGDVGLLSIDACEALLSEHFEGECVVTSSGRSAIDILMRHVGLNRYRSRVALTPMISRCVLDVTVIHAYPVDPTGKEKYDFVLRYHQMGIPQMEVSDDVPVIEDICHAFFADLGKCLPEAGKRWAVFSLPKFFPTAGMVGGIVVQDRYEASALRELRDRSEVITDAEQQLQEVDFQQAYAGDPRYSDRLEMLYLKRRLNRRCHSRDLAGFPLDLKALKALRLRRRDVMQHLLESIDDQMFPPSWYEQLDSWLPFALPIFLNGEERMNAAAFELNSKGIQAGIYSIDVNRNQTDPNLQRALLVPCHHQLSGAVCDMIVSVLRGSAK